MRKPRSPDKEERGFLAMESCARRAKKAVQAILKKL